MHTKECKIGLPYKECNVNLELWYNTNDCVYCPIHYTIFACLHKVSQGGRVRRERREVEGGGLLA